MGDLHWEHGAGSSLASVRVEFAVVRCQLLDDVSSVTHGASLSLS
jgi:hypothetical protein